MEFTCFQIKIKKQKPADSCLTWFDFPGHHFISKDTNDTVKSDTIESAFKELHSDVDAVFSYQNHLYMIKVNCSLK